MSCRAAIGFVILFVVGCGGEPKAEPVVPAGAATNDVSAPPASSAAAAGNESQEGAACGEDVAVQKKCAAGLVCAPNDKAPISEHTPGVCKKK